MIFDAFFTILSMVLAVGFSVAVVGFHMVFKPSAPKPSTVRAVDILAREGYNTAPRTRRRGEFAYV